MKNWKCNTGESKICLKCGNTFLRTHHRPKVWKITKFCSKKCSGEYFSGENSPLFKDGKYIEKEKTCPKCNKIFTSVYTFCSKDCANKYYYIELTEKDRQERRKNTLSKYRDKCIKRKELMVKYKGGKCEKCGYSKCIASLDFHHLDPDKKEFSISKIKHKSLELLYKEVDKCILICANCHKELHYKGD